MSEDARPRVPGGRGGVDLPCGETVAVTDLDMGLREVGCDCGGTHAVVQDVHPLSRFVPEAIVDTLRAAVETADDSPGFATAHLMGMVLEEFPEEVTAADVSDDGRVGYGMVWIAEFDARRLHEIAVELLVELMDHAVSHATDETAADSFQEQLDSFDVKTFVDQYRRERDFEDEHDSPV